jgi:hypothetical protein
MTDGLTKIASKVVIVVKAIIQISAADEILLKVLNIVEKLQLK